MTLVAEFPYGVRPMLIHVLILNYNGRHRLAECLPSVLHATEVSRFRCDVAVIDNSSTDGSAAWLADRYPQVRVLTRANRGLCSYNQVVAELEGPVAVLLNNDIKLDPQCLDPLLEPLLPPRPKDRSACFMTAPLCWLFDGKTYEGFRTAVRWRWGLVQATALYPGHQAMIHESGLTASAGAALAVDCRKFVELGGFDPLYLPGRLEDLDFAFRGYQAGYHARYVPRSVAYHRGMATFGEVFGSDGCDHLALRNTLLFQWKNLRAPRHVARQLAGLPLRIARDILRAPRLPRRQRWAFLRALLAAQARWRQQDALRGGWGEAQRCPNSDSQTPRGSTICRERLFFHRFHPRRIAPGDAEPGAAAATEFA